jgi:hypothetical protein
VPGHGKIPQREPTSSTPRQLGERNREITSSPGGGCRTAPTTAPHGDLLQLQRQLGNRAVGALLRSGGAPAVQRNVIQRRGKHMTFLHADPTVDTQATNAEATVNSVTLGKVFHEGGSLDAERTKLLTDAGYDYSGHAELKIIAEYLFREKYDQLPKDPATLSIRLNRAPCGSCATSLVKFKTDKKLTVRIKASSITQEEGVPILQAGGIPFRLWSREQRESKVAEGWVPETVEEKRLKLAATSASERLEKDAQKKFEAASSVLGAEYEEIYTKASKIKKRKDLVAISKDLATQIKDAAPGREKKQLQALRQIYDGHAKLLRSKEVTAKGSTRELKHLDTKLAAEEGWLEQAKAAFPDAGKKWKEWAS